jgi:LEA14-like dessication related protein
LFIRIIGLSVLALLVAGCAVFGGYRDDVRVTVSDIRIVDATVLEQLYDVTLRIQNRGERPIAIRGGSFDLAINGRDFGAGVSDQQLTVPAYADAQISVRMVSTVFGMLRLIEGLQQDRDGRIDYEISGRLALDNAFGGLSFRDAGEIALPRGAAEGV